MPAAGDGPRHERRLLTVLFAGVVGVTAAADGADPEDVRARVQPFHALVRREAGRTGGTVARVVGDGVMVVWGYPVAREDDAVRAIRAALAIRDGAMAMLGDVHVRVGVNTGEAVVAFGSADERADDAMGDAVNVAARLATAAPPDGVVVGEATARLAGDRLAARALVPVTVKGKAEPVRALLAEGLAETRTASAGPFVGRERDLEALAAAMDKVRSNGRPTRLLLTGEPGIGKSRLLAELRSRALSSGSITWHTGRCRPDRATPGWAMGEIVKAWAGIVDDDPADVAAARLDAALATGTPERDWLRDRLGPLVGITPGTDGPGTVEVEEREMAWARFLSTLAADRPAVIEFEDVHWADPDLAGFIAGPAIDSLTAPVLVLATARPEAVTLHPELASLERHALKPLDPIAARALVAITAPALDDDDRTALVERSGGNPLFTGELVRLVAQRGAGTGDRALLPETVQAVIAARLDLVDSDVRAVARDAAVVGGRFWRGALADLARQRTGAHDVDVALRELVRLELVRPAQASTLPGHAEYAFRHALVRDVAYGQLTRGDRARRHAAVARWLADTGGPDRADLAAAIADHDLRALDYARSDPPAVDADAVRRHAYQHLMTAGAQARSLDAAAAVRRYAAAAEVAALQSDTLAALLRLAEAQRVAGAVQDAGTTIDRAIDLAEDLRDDPALAEAYLARSRITWWLHPERGPEDIAAAIALLEPLGPSRLLAEAYAIEAGNMIYGVSPDGDGLAAVQRSLDVTSSLGISPLLAALRNRGMLQATVDRDAGLADLRAAIELSTRAGDTNGVLGTLELLGVAHLALAELADAGAAFRQMAETARQRGMSGQLAAALFHVGLVDACRGDMAAHIAATDACAQAVALCQGDTIGLIADATAILGAAILGDDRRAEALTSAFRSHPDRADSQLSALVMILAAAADGDATACRSRFRMLVVQPDRDPMTFDVESALEYLPVARALRTVGAGDLIAAMLPRGSWGTPSGDAIGYALAGHDAAWQGDAGAARAHFREAIVHLDAIGFRPEAAHTREALADVLDAAGGHGREEARVLREAALGAWEAMGVDASVARVRRSLGRA